MDTSYTVEQLLANQKHDSHGNIHFVVDGNVVASLVSMDVCCKVNYEVVADELWNNLVVCFPNAVVLLLYLSPLAWPLPVDLLALHYAHGVVNGLAFQGDFRPADWRSPDMKMLNCMSSDLEMDGDLDEGDIFARKLLLEVSGGNWAQDVSDAIRRSAINGDIVISFY